MYDALIVGGGPSGSAAAILLSRAGWKVGLVEKSRFPRRKVCGEFISATSLPLLQALGIADSFATLAGPPVREVALYAGNTIVASEMPGPAYPDETSGRALGREHLDALLLTRAGEAGAAILQPWAVSQIEGDDAGFACHAVASGLRERRTLRARLLIAAHGSWQPGTLPTQPERAPRRSSDLFAFKAHFTGTALPEFHMPLIAFPGGYGGMVRSDSGRTTLSCCIQRQTLDQCRRNSTRVSAGDAVLDHLQRTTLGVRAALQGARRSGPWLSAGPIRPGIRGFRRGGLFAVGNAAGEAHPLVAEGISMALQSAWLLSRELIERPEAVHSETARHEVASAYERSWRKHFAGRIYASAVFAQLAMHSASAALAAQFLRQAPSALALGARLSGKTHVLN
jgi:flavin-dependent dehydrogenase